MGLKICPNYRKGCLEENEHCPSCKTKLPHIIGLPNEKDPNPYNWHVNKVLSTPVSRISYQSGSGIGLPSGSGRDIHYIVKIAIVIIVAPIILYLYFNKEISILAIIPFFIGFPLTLILVYIYSYLYSKKQQQ